MSSCKITSYTRGKSQPQTMSSCKETMSSFKETASSCKLTGRTHAESERLRERARARRQWPRGQRRSSKPCINCQNPSSFPAALTRCHPKTATRNFNLTPCPTLIVTLPRIFVYISTWYYNKTTSGRLMTHPKSLIMSNPILMMRCYGKLWILNSSCVLISFYSVTRLRRHASKDMKWLLQTKTHLYWITRKHVA